MARVTVEDCIEKVQNRFELIIAASQRAREISNGVQIEVDKDNDKNTVISLREIGDGAITYDDLKERYLKSLQKVVVNNDEDEENDIEEEFSSYLNQEETDQNYFEGMLQCYNKRNQYNLLATHNLESINNAIKMNKRHNIFKVAHLMGMNERNMKKYEGRINIGTYVPYGPYKEMIPYLGRRLYENIDTVKYMLK